MCITALNYGAPDNAHAMVLAGFGRIDIGDIYHLANGATIQVEKGNENIGKTYWIYKNSYGIGSGLDGYLYHVNTENQPVEVIYYNPPFTDLKLTTQIPPEVHDLDKDGYINWGIDDNYQPQGAEKDSDDSDPRLGPFDENYYSIPVTPVMEIKHGNNTIPNNSFYSFYNNAWASGHEVTLTFTINNTGSAQLNLMSNNFDGTVTLSDYDENDFEVDSEVLITTLPKETGTTTFDIIFTLNDPITNPKIATVTIHLNEDDIADYVFTLVFGDCATIGIPEFISHGITVWEGNIVKYADVTVNPDATLIITGNIAFANNAQLNIDKGGEVIIDHGHITALCGFWPGIDVWGDITKTQFNSPPEVKLNQGKIKVINSGKISFAVKAIETIKYVNGEPDLSTSGGIVYINNGNIENCIRGVVFYPYKNFYPTIYDPQSNWSSFYKVKFYNDHTYPMSQILFDRVDGITIKGCDFENNLPIPNQQFFKTMAIYSFNGEFRISDITMPDPNEESLKTTFKGFDYGIYAQGARSQEYISIRSSVFEDNERGIYLAAIDNAFIVQNTFLVRNKYSKYVSSTELIGLYLDGITTGFTVEENTFATNIHYNYLETELCNGITINNSGETPNELYKNYFTNLTVGIAAGGENRDADGAGLCIKCNDFNSCVTDIFVSPGERQSGPTIGIAVIQGVYGGGDPDLAAGNTFSSGNVSNFNNHDDCGFIEYTHHYDFGISSKVRPNPFTINTMNLSRDYEAHYDKEISCPSNIGGGIDPNLEKSTLSTENVLIAAYIDTLTMETDGGNTDQLNLDVAVSVPNQAMQLRQQLLDASPYLSDTVMKSAIDKESVLPNAMIRDVLTANPQSAKTQDVLQTLDDRYVQMPGYMIAEILQGQSIIGAKEVIERQLARHRTKYSKALANLERFYKKDTIDPTASVDSLVALWYDQPYPESKYKLAFHYLDRDDSTEVFNTLNNIPIEFDLTSNQEDVHQQYEALFDVLWQTHSDTIEIDTTHFQTLLNITDNYRTLPRVYAMNILIHKCELIYDEPVYFPDYFKSVSAFDDWADTSNKKTILEVFPNPTGYYCTIKYDLSLFYGDANIAITDLYGRKLFSFEPENIHTQKVISLADYSSGIYF
jgi:hypothetical protein